MNQEATTERRQTASERVFDRVFQDSDAQQLTYNPDWNNGTGYFDDLVWEDVVKGEPGAVGVFTTPAPNNRRVIVLKTRLCNIVVFERYTAGHGPMVFVKNVAPLMQDLLRLGAPLTEGDFFTLFGGYNGDTNFGQRLEKIIDTPRQAFFMSPMALRRQRLNPENADD